MRGWGLEEGVVNGSVSGERWIGMSCLPQGAKSGLEESLHSYRYLHGNVISAMVPVSLHISRTACCMYRKSRREDVPDICI